MHYDGLHVLILASAGFVETGRSTRWRAVRWSRCPAWPDSAERASRTQEVLTLSQAAQAPCVSRARPEVFLGIPSAIDAVLLGHPIGVGRARELLLTGDPISALGSCVPRSARSSSRLDATPSLPYALVR
jgi:hypothetical protein